MARWRFSTLLQFVRYLVDIAARNAVKEMRYAGTHAPFNQSATRQADIDSVESDAQVKRFGFYGIGPKLSETYWLSVHNRTCRTEIDR